ncbi:MAG: ABC transporter substrate-binding protein [Myxococcaceae bacterium]|nr:ABC transporter substrate-binding protein [Myxococcaceae bacterium]MCI0669661.1 ABC transporter substrate-binding protein [Myxococcaceae bacterium]
MRRSGFFWLVATVAALAGCKDRGNGEAPPDAGPPGPVAAAEQEPNGRPEQALAVAGDTDVSASLSADPTKPDEDWYALEPGQRPRVDVLVSGLPGGDVGLEVYDEDRNRLVSVNSEGEGRPERLPNLHLTHRRFLKVFPARRGAGGSYTLQVRFADAPAGEEQEPNDRAVDANVVPLGTPVQGLMGHASDEDWYRLELPAQEPAPTASAGGATAPIPGAAPEQATPPSRPETPTSIPGAAPTQSADAPAPEGQVPAPSPQGVVLPAMAQVPGTAPAEAEPPATPLRIELSGVPGVRYDLSILSAAEAPLFQVRGKEGEGLSLRNVGIRGTDRVVYVVVKSAWSGVGKAARRGYSADAPYTLTVSAEEAGANAELEPNDELAKATLLTAGAHRDGFLVPKTDVDYYELRTAGPVLADFHLSGVERLDLTLSVVERTDKGERTLLTSRDGAVKEPEQLNNVVCQGSCFVKVESGLRQVEGKWVKDFENPELPYRLGVTVSPDNGTEEREPNNALDHATALETGRAVRGTVHPRKDVDYFQLDLRDRAVRTPLVASLLGILKVDVGLYLHRVGEDGKLTLVQTADRAKGEEPEIIRYSAEPGLYVLEVRDSKARESNFQDSYQLLVEEGD